MEKTFDSSITREQFREQVRERTDLLTLISRSVALPSRTSGRIVKVKCPFHDDKTASLAVYTDQQRWRCFGSCSEGGDCFAWVMKRDGCDFVTALEGLARDAGLHMPEYRQEAPEKASERAQAAELMELATEYYHLRLLDDRIGLDHRNYLESRGFQRKSWERWQLGASGRGNEFLNVLTRKNVDLGLAHRIGLLGQSDDKSRYYDYFRNRIVIPFIEAGKTVFFTGRAISPDDNPKYLHMPNSEYFKKTPYNWRGSGKDLVIVEGAIDAWAVDALSLDSVSVVALMGLDFNNPLLQRTIKHREKIWVGLDSDGTVSQSVIDSVIQLVGAQRARLIDWPSKDDAAAWYAAGANQEEFSALLQSSPTWIDYLIDKIAGADRDAKPELVEKAVAVAAMLPLALGDSKVVEIKNASKKVVQSSTIATLLKQARKASLQSPAVPDEQSPRNEPQAIAYYRIIEGELWYGVADEPPARIVAGGVPYYTEMITVDDGEEIEMQLNMEIALVDGRKFQVRVPAADSADSGKISAYIKKIAGPRLSIQAYQKQHLIPAMDFLSKKVSEKVEIARMGWLQTDGGLIYVSPGGCVGDLPDGVSVALPQGLERYGIKDDGDEAFVSGMNSIDGLINAFDKSLTLPMLCFALLPPLHRFIPEGQKFVMHLVGETGSLKTASSKTLMSLYGDFVNKPPMASWRSTTNSIEKLGFWLPDALGMVDDYKPRIVKIWDFVDLIQRYADGNDRMRLSRDAQVRRREAMRWWMLSTGEDVPAGESSTLARMVILRFKRRPDGAAYNAELAKAQRLAKFMPTVMARWIAWIRDTHADRAFASRYAMAVQKTGDFIQKNTKDVPNVPRIANNVAMLWVAWQTWCDFVKEQPGFAAPAVNEFPAADLALAQSRQVIEEKPSFIFLTAVREGFEAGRFTAAKRNSNSAADAGGDNFIGYYDVHGFYLLPAAFLYVSRWLREAGVQLGFSQRELYRLLTEEGLLAKTNKAEEKTTVNIKVGGVSQVTRRVLWIKPGIIPTDADQVDADDE